MPAAPLCPLHGQPGQPEIGRKRSTRCCTAAREAAQEVQTAGQLERAGDLRKTASKVAPKFAQPFEKG